MSNQIQVVTEGLEQVIKKVGAAPVRATLDKAGKSSLVILESEAKKQVRDAIKWNDGGQLVNAFRWITGNLEWKLENNKEYAPYFHEGTGIYARNGNGRTTPRWYEDSTGMVWRTKGQRAKPFMDWTYNKKKEEINDLFERNINNLIKSINA